MKVLMVGANGQYAGLVLPELKKRGAVVRALVRDEKGAEKARKAGADEAAVGNLEDSGSLRRAAEGVDGVFHINPAFAPHEGDLGVAMVRAAADAGVLKVVFSGVIHPTIARMSNHIGKQPVEEALYESGLRYVVLQPTMFMQTIAAGWGQAVEKNRFALPYSTQKKASYVDYRDVAEAAAIGLTSNKLDYGTFELCAPGMVDRVELAAMMGEALGKTVEPGELPYDEWADMAHLPQGRMRDGLRAMYADYDRFGFPGGNALVLEAILGRAPRTLQSYLAELAAA